ncbi:MAG TPA: hypothetical protein VJN96_04155 [Vicinamibacterales bacterium]|nr:hypothetical protein [Vicinamibacterales bacterium]
MSVTRLVAIGFALGAFAHSTGLVLLLFGYTLYGPHYPWWRHALMVTFDATIATIALRRSTWLIAALCVALLEQIVVNGFGWVAALVAIAIAACLLTNRHISAYK